MYNIEKIMKGLKICSNTNKTCVGCPYNGHECCQLELRNDAFQMLKEVICSTLAEIEEGENYELRY